ncbi:glycosyltransferase family 2 protein [Deinococcus sp. MIMF12]|uniref:Glycosyltransferase family 2 protein n=1 Tax=Deinococcus rhizophilus TaxID=3049544 RepID=A0ABT7JM49_9DEIO|nr:glycosyltransferase family 2 protein [Deinococcus rhizophilus]MDL2345560.1 glycosyltransferase family 2 protein [Deinococcus rhizophilus]
MQEPRVGIVLLNWNGWQDTAECLESLRGLTYRNFEILLIDNGSVDDSVSQLRQRFPEINLTELPHNIGFSRASNLGTRMLLERGADYIWLLNNDTTVSTLALTELVRTAQTDPRLGLVASVLYDYGQPGKVQAWGGGTLHPYLLTLHHHFAPADSYDHLLGTSLLIRRELIDQIGLLDERYVFSMEDTEYSLRARQHGWRLGVADASRVYHKGGATTKREHGRDADLQADLKYTRPFGLFMRLTRRPLAAVVLKWLAILVRRAMRGQWHKLAPLTAAYWEGYRAGGQAEKEAGKAQAEAVPAPQSPGRSASGAATSNEATDSHLPV